MTPRDYIRLGIYGLALVTGAVIAVIAAVRADASLLATALAWIGTNILAAVNIHHSNQPDAEDLTTSGVGDHAA